MSDIRFEGWLHRSGTGGVYQDSAGNVGIASTQPQQKLDIGNGGFQVGPTGIATVTTINTTNIINATSLSHRNLIINGAMMVAQRGTSSSAGNGYYTVDRMKFRSGGNDETNTVSQITLNNTDTGPYQKGFRYAYRIQNGNQTGGAGTSDWSQLEYHPEAQDLANSGWDYTNSNSFITLSFWIRSSVGQRFYGYMDSIDGTGQRYSFAIDGGSALSANTWRFVSITIPGNSNLQFDNNTDNGLDIKLVTFYGTDYTDNSYTMNNWAATGSNYMPDYDSTWYTTNDATWDITGLQFEVGSEATPFEHRSYGDELRRCQRYYNKVYDVEGQSGEKPFLLGTYLNSSELATVASFPKMRGVPSLDVTNGSNKFMIRRDGASDNFDTFTMRYGTSTTAEIYVSSNVSGTAGQCGIIRGADTDVYIAFSAEL